MEGLTPEQFKAQGGQIGGQDLSSLPPPPTGDIKGIDQASFIKMGGQLPSGKLSGDKTSALLGGISNETPQVEFERRKAESLQANAPGTIAKEAAKSFLPNLGKTLTKTLLDPAAKFAASAVRSPIDIARGLFGKAPMQGAVKLPSGEEAQTIQAEYGKKIGEAETGLEAASGITGAIGETAGGAADILGISQAVTSKPVKQVGEAISKKLEPTQEDLYKESLDVVSPKLTAKETEKALIEGRGTGGGMFTRTKITPDKRLTEVAKATQGIVSKNASGAENIANVKNALTSEAESLKGAIAEVDHPYSFKELSSKLSNVEEPISLRGTAFEKQIKPVKEAAIQFAKDAGGKISGLLDARKNFDALVDRTYPTLYDKESAPMRNAITAIRNEMNNFIEANLPKGSGFRESLKKQSLFYDAIDNIATKAVEETKTIGVERALEAIRKHPIISTGAAGAAGYGASKITQP